jgi:uncharacterized protein with FMN-binding domain
MMAKKFIVMMAVLAVLSLMITACFIELDPTDIAANETPYGNPPDYYNGTKEGTAQGYGQVKVEVTLTAGFITDVKITAPSDNLGTQIIAQVSGPSGLVVKANSFDIDALSASSLTLTKAGIINAGKAALAKIPGYEQ